MFRSFRKLVFVLFLASVSQALSAEPLTNEQYKDVVSWIKTQPGDRPDTNSLDLPNELTMEEADEMLRVIWDAYCDNTFDAEVGDLPLSISELEPEPVVGAIGMRVGKLSLVEDMEMRYLVLRKERPRKSTNRALFICTHGSGPTPQEWTTQIQLAIQRYQPEGVYFVPRMPEGSGKRWIRGHNQDAYERVIEQAIAHWGVDPNRVYFLGISQGGFATDKLLPFMPDRFAAGNAMASGVNPDNHPPENLRNTAYRTDVGEKDTMFNRVGNAIKFHERLDTLQAADAEGYVHSIAIQKGKGHGIDYRPGVVWISKQKRDPWPNKLVWRSREFQGKRRDRHYWISIEGEEITGTTLVSASADRESNTITVTAEQLGEKPKDQTDAVTPKPLSGVALQILLHDDLVDLDRTIQVTCNDETVFEGKVKRSTSVLLSTLANYGDPSMAAKAEIQIQLE